MNNSKPTKNFCCQAQSERARETNSCKMQFQIRFQSHTSNNHYSNNNNKNRCNEANQLRYACNDSCCQIVDCTLNMTHTKLKPNSCFSLWRSPQRERRLLICAAVFDDIKSKTKWALNTKTFFSCKIQSKNGNFRSKSILSKFTNNKTNKKNSHVQFTQMTSHTLWIWHSIDSWIISRIVSSQWKSLICSWSQWIYRSITNTHIKNQTIDMNDVCLNLLVIC